MEITDFPCVGVILFTDCFAFVFCFVFLYKDNSLSLNSSLPSKEEWIRAQKPVWISGTFNWDYGLAFGNIYKHEFKNNIPQCCFDHICDSKKKKKIPVSLHLATFKKKRKEGSSKHLFTLSKCIWMQVFSASVLYNRRKTTDNTQQLGLRPSRTIWNIYSQGENFKGG